MERPNLKKQIITLKNRKIPIFIAACLLLVVLCIAPAVKVYLINSKSNNLTQAPKTLHPENKSPEPHKKSDVKIADRTSAKRITDDKGNAFDTYVVNLSKKPVKIYYQDQSGRRLSSLQALKQYVESNSETLLFATNGGMFMTDGRPVGLLIENGRQIKPLNLSYGDPNTNFYWKPNGVFAVTENRAMIVESSQFGSLSDKEKILYATQSGPLLLLNSQMHPKFEERSSSVYIRSGVGMISSIEVVFAISVDEVNFYDFAQMFAKQFNCKDALYLDGAISEMYMPTLERYDSGGDFAGMIAVTE